MNSLLLLEIHFLLDPQPFAKRGGSGMKCLEPAMNVVQVSFGIENSDCTEDLAGCVISSALSSKCCL